MPRAFFFVVAILLFISSHVYLARRLFIRSEAFPTWLRYIGASAIGLLGTLAISVIILPRMQIAFLNNLAVQLVGYLWLGTFVFLLVLTLLRDLGWMVMSLVQKYRTREQSEGEKGLVGDAPISRRALFFSMSSGVVLSTAAASTAVGYQEARRLARVKRQDILLKDLPSELEGLTIVQISDLHIGPTIKRDFIQAVVDQVNELNPDLIAITGDLADGLPEDLREDTAPLKQLRSKLGVFYVTGNHEYYWDAVAWVDAVREMGFTPLVNEHKVVKVGNASFVVAGVTDYSAQRILPEHTSDAVKALKNAPEDAAFKLLLAHQPKSIYDASRAKATLQLSGHTHGGQFYPLNMVVGLAHPFSVGLGLYEDTQIYVSRGTGYWGPPIRLGAPSEISLLTLRRA